MSFTGYCGCFAKRDRGNSLWKVVLLSYTPVTTVTKHMRRQQADLNSQFAWQCSAVLKITLHVKPYKGLGLFQACSFSPFSFPQHNELKIASVCSGIRILEGRSRVRRCWHKQTNTVLFLAGFLNINIVLICKITKYNSLPWKTWCTHLNSLSPRDGCHANIAYTLHTAELCQYWKIWPNFWLQSKRCHKFMQENSLLYKILSHKHAKIFKRITC